VVNKLHGGLKVAAVKLPGFGSRLIERGLAGERNGEVRLDYDPEGDVCTIDVPIQEADVREPAMLARDELGEGGEARAVG
jgi:two-component sensor histidine kinase